MLIKTMRVLEQTNSINNIPCRFLFFEIYKKGIKCQIEFVKGAGLTIDMLKNYLEDKGLRPCIGILEDGILIGSNGFSLADKQYANLYFFKAIDIAENLKI